MRRLFMGLVVAATTVVFPVWALAANQEVAEQIAANLRKGGQLHDYKIGVKFQDGTAWLQGRVADQDQLKSVLEVVSRTEGVRRVVNKLTVGAAEAAPAAETTADSSSVIQLRAPGGSVAPEQVVRPGQELRQRCSGQVTHPAQRLQQVVDTKASPAATPVRQAHPLATSYVPAPAQATQAMSEVVQPEMMSEEMGQPIPQQMVTRSNRPVPVAYMNAPQAMAPQAASRVPAYAAPMASGVAPAQYDQPHMPNNAWPSYAAYPNYAAVTYPKQYSPTAWPYIGPFYPYPQVPLGWRKVTLEWDDGWWMLDFKD
ncbi:MAG: BON domain-containing protein [Planctomycetia bacterium]|nr:BON domain-containing protein [Planctomycetia bacterium]